MTAPERKLYPAIPDDVYADVFEQRAVQHIIARYRLALIVVNVKAEEIIRWIN